MNSAIRLTLYGRPDCGLCQDMLATLEDMQIALDFIDIDDDPALQQRFGTLIPVLVHGSKIICTYHLDQPALAAALNAESE